MATNTTMQRRVLASPIAVAAAQTRSVLTPQGVALTVDGQCLRIDVMIGKSTISGASTINLEHGNLPNVYTVAKTAAITASTDVTISNALTVSGLILTTTGAHSFEAGDLISLTRGTTLPGGLQPDIVYQVATVPTTTTATIRRFSFTAQNAPVVITAVAGAGTNTVCKVQTVGIAIQSVVTADQAFLPLKGELRLTATTAAADTTVYLGQYINSSM